MSLANTGYTIFIFILVVFMRALRCVDYHPFITCIVVNVTRIVCVLLPHLCDRGGC